MDVWVKKGYTLSRSLHKTRFSVLLVTKGMLVDGFGRLVSIRHFFFLSAKKSGKGMERAKTLGKEGEKWIPSMKREFAESFPS